MVRAENELSEEKEKYVIVSLVIVLNQEYDETMGPPFTVPVVTWLSYRVVCSLVSH